MPLPLLEYSQIAQNARVKSYSVGSEEDPRRSPEGLRRSPQDMDALIERSYRQIFFHAFKVDRDAALESQFRNGQITTRLFIRGLLLSPRFREGFYRCNSNYAMVDQIVGRVLGRKVNGDGERLALSILIAQRGLEGCVDALLESNEYLDRFGEMDVPQQLGRVLPGNPGGELPFNQQAPRYTAYWRDAQSKRAPAGPFRGTRSWGSTPHMVMGTDVMAPGPVPAQVSPTWKNGQPPRLALNLWLLAGGLGALELVRVLLTTAGAMLSTGSGG
jgi:phycobilisome rod-core linker protein